MSDSGFTNIPPGARPAPQSQQNAPAERPHARITELPRDLQDVREITRIRGEVVRQKVDRATRETTIEVRTPRGDVEVRIPPDQPAPREGQKVEIEIQPGRPPTQARVETVRAEPTPVDQRHASTTTTHPEQPRPTATPVNIEVGTPQETTTAPRIERPATSETRPLPQTLPEPGTIVRLQPIPAREAAALITQNLPELITTQATQIIAQTTFQAQTISTQAITETLNQLVNVTAHPHEIKVQTAQPITHNFAGPPLTAPQTEARALLSQNLDFSATPPTLQPIQLLKITSSLTTPVVAGASSTLQTPSLKQPIDVQIHAIHSPRVDLAIPGTENIAQNTKTSEHAPPQILSTKAPGILTGTIIGATPENLPVLNIALPQLSSAQSFALQIPSKNITIGTQIDIIPQTNLAAGAHAGATAAASSITPPFSTLLTPAPWPLMEELYQTLARVAPQAAQTFSTMTPNAATPAQVTPAALFFMAAIRGGDLTQWLGDKTTALLRSAGRGNLLSRLTQEGSALSRLSSETVSQDWRAISLPMFYEGEIQKIALHYKHEDHTSPDGQDKSKHTRFIFDLNLDQMGEVQVDGLFHAQHSAGRLDVVVRTQETLSQAMQMDMRQTYAKALKKTEVTGELTFQNQPDQWVTIQAEPEQSLGVEA